MKNCKRILMILLILIMAVISFDVPATAESEPETDPTLVFSSIHSVKMSNSSTTAAITTDGDLYMWGNNTYGQVGNGTLTHQWMPVKVLSDVVDVVINDSRSAAITKDGTLYMWGWNRFGSVGAVSADVNSSVTTPTAVLTNVTSVSFGTYHSAAVTDTGDLYTWGWNYHGQIGDGTFTNQYIPTKIMSDVASVSLGEYHCAALTRDGTLYTWGYNGDGDLGLGITDMFIKRPQKVMSGIASVHLSGGTNAALTPDGDLYMWGENLYGEVGIGSTASMYSPVRIRSNIEYVDVTRGGCAAIDGDGNLYIWGRNTYGQVGDGSYTDMLRPYHVLSNVRTVSLGLTHSAAITADGDLYVWGTNENGAVGIGNTEEQLTPIKVMSDVASCSMGRFHSTAIDKNGVLYTWGHNGYGEIGNGTKINRLSPYAVGTPYSREEDGTFTKNVRYFREWDAENQIAYFGRMDLLGSQVTSESDASFLESIDALVEQYVLVETKSRTDSLIAPDTLISIQAVESRTGTVTSADLDTITIGGETFATPEDLTMPGLHEGLLVLYHVCDGQLVGLSELETEDGLMTYWNADTRELTIDPDGIAAGAGTYWLSPLADENSAAVLGESGLKNENVHFRFDYNHFVYSITTEQGSSPETEQMPDEEPVTSGKCGENLTWELDEDGVLYISGTGDMKDFELAGDNYEATDAPWFEHREDIIGVVLNPGVASIGTRAFDSHSNLKTVTLPASISKIGENAFALCESLKIVYFKGSVEKWNTLRKNHGYLQKAAIIYNGHKFDVWGFDNSSNYVQDSAKGYYLSAEDYNRLTRNLSEKDREAVTYTVKRTLLGNEKVDRNLSRFNIGGDSAEKYMAFDGFCHGYNTWICLQNGGTLNFSIVGNREDVLLNCSLTAYVESAINYYYAQQFLPAIQNASEAFMRLSQREQLVILEKYAKNGKPFMINYGWTSYAVSADEASTFGDELRTPMHSVIGYGWEKLDEPKKVTINGKTYSFDYRVLIYDCADPEQKTQMQSNADGDHISLAEDWDKNLYYNDHDEWCIPGRYIISVSSQIQDQKNDNGKLLMVTGDPEVLNAVDFYTGKTSTNQQASACGQNSVALSTSADASYMLSWGESTANIKGFTVSGSEDVAVTLTANASSESVFSAATATAFVPKGSGTYSVEAVEPMRFAFTNSDYYACAALNTAGTMAFSEDGTVSFSSEEATDYYLDLVANDGCRDLPWHKVEVTGSGASEIATQMSTDGLVLSGDDLSSVTLAVTDDNGTTQFEAGTEGNSLLITHNDGKLAVCEDVDGDGFFEKDIRNDIDYGTCGDAVRWKLTGDGILTIWGTGTMQNYTAGAAAPWSDRCADITGISIGKGITSIGAYAFCECTALTNVSIPESVTTIGNSAFRNCTGLTQIELPDSLTSIGAYTFSGCSVLKGIGLPDSLTSIDNGAFLGCTGLTEMVLPAGITTISNGVFQDCSNLAVINIPDGVRSIGTSAFRNSGLLEIKIPASTSIIKTSAFSGCSKLTTVELSEGLKTIDSSAFLGCSSLTRMDIPQSVTTLSSAAFQDCTGLQTISLPPKITCLNWKTFSGCTSLTSVVIPDAVDYIGAEVFYNCTSLTKVILPESLLEIDSDAFYSCTALRTLVLPDGLRYIGQSAFYRCGFITQHVPASVESIGDMAFLGCPDLEEVFIHNDEMSFGYSSFWGDVLIFCHEGSTAETYAVRHERFYCAAPAGEALGHRYDGTECSLCTNGVYPLASGSSGDLDWTLMSDGRMTISGTGAMQDYTDQTDVPWYSVMDRISDIVVRVGVTSIGDHAFSNTTALHNVTLPESLIRIGSGAFYGSALTEITLPTNVAEIDSVAFGCCASLSKITFQGDAPLQDAIAASAFEGVTASVYYPADNATWTESNMLDYGGDLTWIGHGKYDVVFSSASVSLAGDIGVNYYAKLSDAIVADEGAYMQFTVAGLTQIVPLCEAEVSADGTYRFTCKVAAKQMTEEITGQMYLGDGTAVGEAKVYSVKAYCDAAIPVYSQYAAYADLVDLMEAMLNYGGYSQTQFGNNTDNLANAGMDTTLPTITAADVDAYAHGATGSEDGISVASVSLLLESTTTIRFYFELDGTKSIDEYTFYVDGVETTPVESNGQYYVDKVNVAAKDLDEMVTVTIGGLTVKYCGLSYVRQVAVLYPSHYSEALVNVAKALYAYNQAANAYFA